MPRLLLSSLLACMLLTLGPPALAEVAMTTAPPCRPGMACPTGAVVQEPLVALTPADARLAVRCALDLPDLRLDLARAGDRAAAAESERDVLRMRMASAPAAGATPAARQASGPGWWSGLGWGLVGGAVGLAAVEVAIIVWAGR